MRATILACLAVATLGPAQGADICHPTGWIKQLELDHRVGKPRCCFCIGSPDECAKAQVIKNTIPACEKMIGFRFNSAVLSKKESKKLDVFAKLLKHSELNKSDLTISGYTDAIGSESFNLALSKRRADNVKRYLIRAGFSPDRFQVVGLGKNIQGQLPSAKSDNRRVKIVLRHTAGIH